MQSPSNPETPSTTDRLVTIATYNKPFEANVARNFLTDLGFEAYLSNEMLVLMDWAAGTAFGDVQLQVPEHEAESAHQALQEQPETAEDDTRSEESNDDEPSVPFEGEELAAR